MRLDNLSKIMVNYCRLEIVPFVGNSKEGHKYIYQRLYLMQLLNKTCCNTSVSRCISNEIKPLIVETSQTLDGVVKDYIDLIKRCPHYDCDKANTLENVKNASNNGRELTQLVLTCPLYDKEKNKCSNVQ
ncbi:Uncharacterised protein [Candidatus Tiddalikarchaeum anstoanum]|nr:Uncharacterised protein [Candidatus Tiddalikarchaeum anstoanum]